LELAASRRAVAYVAVAGCGHFVWETAQLPLYTIWQNGTAVEIAVAVVHCAAGDVLITIGTLLIAALIASILGWQCFDGRMLIAALVLGIAYTVFSEWLNVEVRRSWSYSPAMPVLPWFGTGLSPVLQWLVVPGVAAILTFGWQTSLMGLSRRR
jgi:hypothetical protein